MPDSASSMRRPRGGATNHRGSETAGVSALEFGDRLMAAFEPARQLYAGFGFTYCEPFGDYMKDSNSVFMTMEL